MVDLLPPLPPMHVHALGASGPVPNPLPPPCCRLVRFPADGEGTQAQELHLVFEGWLKKSDPAGRNWATLATDTTVAAALLGVYGTEGSEGHPPPRTPRPPPPFGPIPRLLHHIWLGGPLPSRFARLRTAWREVGWQLVLWGDDDLASLPLFNVARLRAAGNPGEQSDILVCTQPFCFCQWWVCGSSDRGPLSTRLLVGLAGVVDLSGCLV
jgi:hypothetical protein